MSKTAFVTGASRGIGKAIALRLGRGGYDVAITARSVSEGEQREHSSSITRSDTSPLPGGLASTAETLREMGVRALPMPADLLDLSSLDQAATAVLGAWGHIDVVVHSGRFIGPGLKDWTLDTPIDILQNHIQANAIAAVALNHRVLPSMIARGSGTIIYVTSIAAYQAPTATVDKGGWGLSYAMSKAAGHAIAGVLCNEYSERGVRAFNLLPGAVLTERIAMEMDGSGHEHLPWEPMEVPAEAAYWLATSPEAAAHNGTNIDGPALCHKLGLLPDWRPKISTA